MAKNRSLEDLHPRERQIMEIVFCLGRATAVQVMAEMTDRLSNPAVRKMLSVLETKGYLVHERIKGQFFYSPTFSKEKARTSRLEHLLKTLYRNEEEQAVMAILRKSEAKIAEDELAKIIDLVRKAKREGR